MRPFRTAIVALVALTAGCASSETPEPQARPAATEAPREAARQPEQSVPRRESVLDAQDGRDLMRTDRGSGTETRIDADASITRRIAEPSAAEPSPAIVPAPRPAPEDPSGSLTPRRALVRPGAPIELMVRARAGHGPLSIVLLDRAGRVVDRMGVAPGTVDLTPLASTLDRLDRAVWLQLREGERSIGSPVWCVPLRAAPPVRTVRSIRASNQQPYLRVVGWGDRAYNPADPETAAALPNWTAADPVVTAGFRLERAVDAVLVTEAGPIRVSFAPDAAPATVDNFLRLAREGFYEGTIFHRVVPLDRDGRPFVVQGGDPTGTGDGGPGWNLALEPSDLPHDRGVLGMARGDEPHSAGSQFYVSLSREGTARLDGQYCTFAAMVDGWDALDRIAAGAIGDATTGRPAVPVRIERVELVPAPPRDLGPWWAGPPKPPAPEPISPSPSPTR